MKTRRTLLAVPLVLVLLVAGYVFLYKPDRVIIVKPEWAFNINKKELLVGWADNVFTGVVVKKEKEIRDEVGPLTIYRVRVEKNIKGNLAGEVTVMQRIGYDNLRKALFKFEGDDYLQEGRRYLLVAKYNEVLKSHVIVPVTGHILIDSAEKEKAVLLEFEEAKKKQKNPEKGYVE